MTPVQPTMLDLNQARDLAVNAAQLRGLLQTLERSLNEEIENISQALSDHDQGALEFSLHTLKGFLAMFVVPALALQIEVLYNNCRQQPLAVTVQEFNSLVPNLRTLSSEVRAWLSL